MSKYWTTVKHFKAKPSEIRMEHIWRHTLRYGNKAIAFWTITDLSPVAVVSHSFLHDHQLDTIQLYLEADKNKFEVYPQSQSSTKSEGVDNG